MDLSELRNEHEGETSRLYFEHVQRLATLCDGGDEDACRSLACISLVVEGWRYGDPDPVDPDDPDGGLPVTDNVVSLKRFALKRAA